MKFSEDETITLVNLFAEHDCLWDLRSPHYRNKDMRTAAEKEILEKISKTGFGLAELKQKIKNLRCTYNQECLKIRKSMKSGAGANDIYIPNIKWFDAFDKIMKLSKGGKKTDCSVETNISENTNDDEEEEGTVHEPCTPEIQSSKALSNTPASDKPPAGKRRKLENLREAVQQLREATQTIQDSSNNEHEAFGNFVAATLNNLKKADALMAQHDIQAILLKYRLANVDSPKHSSLQVLGNSTQNPQTKPCYSRDSYDNTSLESSYSNHSTDGYNNVHDGEGTSSTFYEHENTNLTEENDDESIILIYKEN